MFAVVGLLFAVVWTWRRFATAWARSASSMMLWRSKHRPRLPAAELHDLALRHAACSSRSLASHKRDGSREEPFPAPGTGATVGMPVQAPGWRGEQRATERRLRRLLCRCRARTGSRRPAPTGAQRVGPTSRREISGTVSLETNDLELPRSDFGACPARRPVRGTKPRRREPSSCVVTRPAWARTVVPARGGTDRSDRRSGDGGITDYKALATEYEAVTPKVGLSARPQIVVREEPVAVTDEALAALKASPTHDLYVRGRLLVQVARSESAERMPWLRRPEGAPVIVPVEVEAMKDRLDRAARWVARRRDTLVSAPP